MSAESSADAAPQQSADSKDAKETKTLSEDAKPADSDVVQQVESLFASPKASDTKTDAVPSNGDDAKSEEQKTAASTGSDSLKAAQELSLKEREATFAT